MSKITKTFTELYEKVFGDGNGEHAENEAYLQIWLNSLIDLKLIRVIHEDDFITSYEINEGITRRYCRANYGEIDNICREQLLILLELTEDDDTFFIYQNPQKGKSAIVINELIKWHNETKYAVVSFLVLSNGISMGCQTVKRIKKDFAEQGKKIQIFELSSAKNMKNIIEDIRRAIASWAMDKKRYGMPIVCLLHNDKQLKKMLEIIKYIYDLEVNNPNNNIRYGVIWDEADETYAKSRNKEITVNSEKLSCKMFMVDNTKALYRLGFVSATDGGLLIDGDKENYPECAGAVNYYNEFAEDNPHYRAIHLPGAIIKNVEYTAKEKLNSFAERVLEENAEHFKTPENLPTGEEYRRKILVNGNVSCAGMAKFAKEHSKKGYYVIVYNSDGCAGLKVYKDGELFRSYPLKNWYVNERLFYIYKALNLSDKPLIVIGGLKIDRGITFHYCPTENNEYIIGENIIGEEKKRPVEHGNITTVNKEGLVFTDYISGPVENVSSAVQKGGRLHGNIGDSPQYSGETYYWSVKSTIDKVINHNNVVDMINKDIGLECIKDKKDRVNKEYNTMLPILPKANHNVSANLFRVYRGKDEADMRKVVEKLYNNRKYNHKFPENENGFLLSSITKNIKKNGAIAELCYAIKEVPGTAGLKHKAGGKSAARRAWACYKDINDISTLHFIVLIDPQKVSADKLKMIDTEYPNHITIPEEGDF